MTFNWEVNLPVLFTLVAMVGGGIRYLQIVVSGIADARRAAKEARDIAVEAKDEAHRTSERLLVLQANIAAFREIQAEKLVSREVLREVEGRLADAIEAVGTRLDSCIRELFQMRSRP